MGFDVHKLIESIFNVAKICALVAAGVWTYYQWDRVVFPRISEEKGARNASLRADVDFSFDDISLSLINVLNRNPQSSNITTKAHSNRSFIIELSGSLRVRNPRQFPVRIEIVSTSLQVRHGYDPTVSSGAEILRFENTISLSLDSTIPFGNSADGYTIIENQSEAIFPFQIPLVLSASVFSSVHQYNFVSSLHVSELDTQNTETISSNSKTKHARIVGIVNGANVVRDRHADDVLNSDKRIDLEAILEGRVLGGANVVFRPIPEEAFRGIFE